MGNKGESQAKPGPGGVRVTWPACTQTVFRVPKIPIINRNHGFVFGLYKCPCSAHAGYVGKKPANGTRCPTFATYSYGTFSYIITWT